MFYRGDFSFYYFPFCFPALQVPPKKGDYSVLKAIVSFKSKPIIRKKACESGMFSLNRHHATTNHKRNA